MAEIKLEKIYKKYGNSKDNTIENLNLKINDKEFMVFVGPSGCGKTTLLRMIAGLEEVSSGNIYIDSQDVTEMEPKERDIAMVFQNYALYPHMSVFGNISYPLKQKRKIVNENGKEEYIKYSKSEIEDKVKKIAESLNLTKLLKRKPKELSGGERQRVALARAMVRNPKVFLMDEPLSNLDAKLRTQTRGEILNLHKTINTTFIYVTHDQTEALTMGDRIAVINKGKIMQLDSPEELYNNPQNIFVAEFIGNPQMNMIDGVLEKDNIIDIIDLGIKLKSSTPINAEIKPVIGIRPENISISESKGILVSKEYVEFTGNEKILHVYKNDLKIRLTIDQNVEARENIIINLNTEKIMLFDSITGRRINTSFEMVEI
ncbi:ABC transporter ATP-binding protein [Peptacetobacter hominis]|uniref:ABC transporter ATP-binding protein n=1 Tax=Peptacetobacter hominis TaxID=2743610 RepID=A0A544QW48_9FIRM|nr:ABC transporter ATP-binding protein [Peptacetobacter hominis]TQQ84920.1 ABC transporter ATP-binding protein [Peptacetobacter hominis]